MAVLQHRIPASEFPPLPPEGYHTLKVRARTGVGAGEASPELRVRPVEIKRKRQVREAGEWVDTSDFAVAHALREMLTRATESERGIVSHSADILSLRSDIGTRATAAALDIVRTAVMENDGDIALLAERISQLRADLAGYATVMALTALTARVTSTETGVAANASEITALEAAHGGRTLGPQQNLFSADTKANAAVLRDAYATANPDWLAQYDADNDINVELRWGVLYIYQRRLNGEWVDNGEALARAAAVTQLNAQVITHGGEIDAVTSLVNAIRASIGDFTAQAFQELTVRVTKAENVDGSQPLGPAQNQFTGTTRAAAVAARNAYAAANPVWLADYDGDDGINIQLRWGDESVYQNRVSGIWVDNAISLGGLARWLVKTQIGDLVAGVGLYNDGTDTSFIVQADHFAIMPPGATRDDQIRVPFIVRGGEVYIDTAYIQNGTITSLKAADAFLTNLTAIHGTLGEANIQVANIFDAIVSRRIQSVGYVAGRAGFYLDRDGDFEFNGGVFRSTIESVDFETGEDGWRLERDGSFELNGGLFRGNLRSDNYNGVIASDGSITTKSTRGWYLGRNGNADFQSILADVRNWDPLWKGWEVVTSSFKAFTVPDMSGYDMISVAVAYITRSSSEPITEILYCQRGRSGNQRSYFAFAGTATPDDGLGFRVFSSTDLRLKSLTGSVAIIGIFGVNNPGTATRGNPPAPGSQTTTDTDTIYIRGSSPPGAPSGGTTVETHTPAGWSRSRPAATSTLGVYSATRTRTYTNGNFTSATAWGGVTRVLAPTGTGTTTDTDTIWRRATSTPATPTGGTGAEVFTPLGWVRSEPSPTTTEGVYRATRTRTYNNGVFVSATNWGGVTRTAAPTGVPAVLNRAPATSAGTTNAGVHYLHASISNSLNPTQDERDASGEFEIRPTGATTFTLTDTLSGGTGQIEWNIWSSVFSQIDGIRGSFRARLKSGSVNGPWSNLTSFDFR